MGTGSGPAVGRQLGCTSGLVGFFFSFAVSISAYVGIKQRVVTIPQMSLAIELLPGAFPWDPPLGRQGGKWLEAETRGWWAARGHSRHPARKIRPAGS